MKTMKQAVVAAGLACMVVLPIAGQQPATPQTPGHGGTQDPAKPSMPSVSGAAKQAAAALSSADKMFMREAAIGGMAEVELGKMAAEKASSAEVKQFGQRMVDDHSKANMELKALASQKGATLPTELDAAHKATSARLATLSGAAFDQAYVRAMVADHDKDVASFRKQSTGGSDADVKGWAAKTLPTLEAHQKMIKEMSTTMMKAPAGAAK